MNITQINSDATALLDLLFVLMLAGMLILTAVKRSRLKKEERRLKEKYNSLIQAEKYGGRHYES